MIKLILCLLLLITQLPAEILSLNYDTKGFLYAVTSSGYLLKYGPDGKQEKERFKSVNAPLGFCFDNDGNMFIADTGNGYIKTLNASTEEMTKFSEERFSPMPCGIALLGKDEIVISDSLESKLYIINSKGENLSSFGKREYTKEGLVNPARVLTGKDGNLYICDTGNFAVKVFNKDAKFMVQTEDLLTSLSDFSLTPSGDIYAVDFKDRSIRIFDGSGRFKRYFKDKLTFLCPALIACSPSDELAVYDAENARISVFKSTGELSFSSQSEPGPKYLGHGVDACTNPEGNIFAVYARFDNVFKRDASGNLLKTYSGSGEAQGLFKKPRGITTDKAGNIFVADSFNSRVQKFDKHFNFLKETTPASGISFPIFIRAAANGNIYVSCPDKKAIIVLDNNLNRLDSIEEGLAPGSIALSKTGILYCADSITFNIRKKDGGKPLETINYPYSSLHSLAVVSKENKDTLYIYDSIEKCVYKMTENGAYSRIKLQIAGRFFYNYAVLIEIRGILNLYDGNILCKVETE